ncbi:unnamed protein product [Caenorhabditis bovis]|uniref:Uncharacterized protein n=1 Tax=Caenorhabditis bovis TaxID=2654633 RepID=A0A8S1F358_9PELO|nr:unnamed protein product [Caenorhabditis bovis]
MASNPHQHQPSVGILRKDAIGKNYFNMENLLTRSLYKVLNNNPTVVRPQNADNVDKIRLPNFHTTVAIARPNNHRIGALPSTDMEMQLKLLAQEICSKVERRYEKKLEEAREKDRKDTERRLLAIKAEYDAKVKVQLSKVEREKNHALDQLAERERTLEHRLEMRISEKEHDVETRRRTIENRMAELMLNKENFEKVKEEWNRKLEAEMEEIRLEKEKLAMNAVQVSARQSSDIVHEHELRMWKKRTKDLENDANETRRKIAELMAENFRLLDENSSVEHIKTEIELTARNLNETRQELAAARLEIRRTADYDRLKAENEQLRKEIEELRIQNSQRIQAAVAEKCDEFEESEQKHRKMLNSAKSRIALLTEKCREFEMERDMLKQELKTMQKMVSRGGFLNSTTKSRTNNNYKRCRRQKSTVSESSTSSLSEGEMEILHIRQRIQNLDEIAKELDASVEHFSFSSNRKEPIDYDDSKVELYDDFCRALHQTSVDDESTTSPKTSSPQKPSTRRRASDEATRQEQPKHLKGIRLISPRIAPPMIEEKPMNVEERIEENKMTEFERRIQERNVEKQQQHQQKVETHVDEPQPASAPAPTPPPPPHSNTSASNQLFTGVDPVMAEYMQKIMQGRKKQEAAVVEAPPKEMEITMGDELQLDKPTDHVNDDEWW